MKNVYFLVFFLKLVFLNKTTTQEPPSTEEIHATINTIKIYCDNILTMNPGLQSQNYLENVYFLNLKLVMAFCDLWAENTKAFYKESERSSIEKYFLSVYLEINKIFKEIENGKVVFNDLFFSIDKLHDLTENIDKKSKEEKENFYKIAIYLENLLVSHIISKIDVRIKEIIKNFHEFGLFLIETLLEESNEGKTKLQLTYEDKCLQNLVKSQKNLFENYNRFKNMLVMIHNSFFTDSPIYLGDYILVSKKRSVPEKKMSTKQAIISSVFVLTVLLVIPISWHYYKKRRNRNRN